MDSADLALKPGMTATVSFEVAHDDNVLMVPNAALRFVPSRPQEKLEQLSKDLEPGQAVLWQVDGDKLISFTATTGIIGDKATEVSGTNINKGTTIAVPLKREDVQRRRGFRLRLF